MKTPIDYTLSKLFHDLYTNKALAAEYRRDREAVLTQYDLSADLVAALLSDNVAVLSQRTNGFLLRYYFVVSGMSDRDFIQRIQELRRG